jgi:hypothetical protein
LIEQIEVFPQVAAEGNPYTPPHLQFQADFALQVDAIIATSTNGGHAIDGFMAKNDRNDVVATLIISRSRTAQRLGGRLHGIVRPFPALVHRLKT